MCVYTNCVVCDDDEKQCIKQSYTEITINVIIEEMLHYKIIAWIRLLIM